MNCKKEPSGVSSGRSKKPESHKSPQVAALGASAATWGDLWLSGFFERPLDTPLGSFLQFIFHTHVILPNQVVEVRRLWIHQQAGALQVIHQAPVAQVG